MKYLIDTSVFIRIIKDYDIPDDTKFPKYRKQGLNLIFNR